MTWVSPVCVFVNVCTGLDVKRSAGEYLPLPTPSTPGTHSTITSTPPASMPLARPPTPIAINVYYAKDVYEESPSESSSTNAARRESKDVSADDAARRKRKAGSADLTHDPRPLKEPRNTSQA